MVTILLLIACAWTALLYMPSIEGPFIFDDTPNIELNEAIRWGESHEPEFGELSFHNPNYRRPVAYVTFGLNHWLHGYDTFGYRVANLVIHLLNGLLLFGLVIAIGKSPAMRMERKRAAQIALVAALLFLVHPVATQSTAYIVQRMTSLATLFYLASLLLYAQGRSDQQRRVWLYSGSALCGLLAIGSKENAATLPISILLFEVYFYREWQWRRVKKRLAIPLAAGAAVTLAIVFLFLGDDPLSRLLSGYASRDFTLEQRLYTELRVVVYYLTLFVFPYPGRLNLDYDFPLSTSLLDPITTLVSVLALLALAAIALITARHQRLLSFAICFFLLNLIIESSFVALEIIYEHRTYLPFTFLFVAVAYYLLTGVRDRRVSLGIIAAIVAVLSFWTYQRAAIWADDVALWQDVASKSPEKARAHHNLGVALRDQSRYREAIAPLKKAIELSPDHPRARQNLADAYYNLGDYETSLLYFRQVADRQPEFAQAYLGQGNALYALNRVAASVEPYRHYIALRPTDASAHLRLGLALAETGHEDAAIKHFRYAAELDAQNVVARRNLAVLMFNRREDADTVIRLLEEASRLEPDNADIWADLGLVLSETPRKSESIPALKRALKLNPDHAAARQLMNKLGK